MSQKLENLLNLALDADQGERERSEELDVGYDKEENVWELIVKYSGTLEAVRQTARSVTELLNGYAAVSYTHLDVYKRQEKWIAALCMVELFVHIIN